MSISTKMRFAFLQFTFEFATSDAEENKIVTERVVDKPSFHLDLRSILSYEEIDLEDFSADKPFPKVGLKLRVSLIGGARFHTILNI